MSDTTTTPSEEMLALNVQEGIKATNVLDSDGNPTGGTVNMRMGERNPLRVQWQDGPRGKDAEDNLGPSNGAFVEDVIWAAYQRLAFFQDSKYAHEANANAMTHLEAALRCLNRRRTERADRGVEGQHEV